MTRKSEPSTLQMEAEKVRNSTLLRAEYVLPTRKPSPELDPIAGFEPSAGFDSSAQRNSPSRTDEGREGVSRALESAQRAETDAKIARAQLVNRVRALARVGNQTTRTLLRHVSGLAGGFTLALLLGTVAVPALFLGGRRLSRNRRRMEGWLASETRVGLMNSVAPLRAEFLQLIGVTLAHWARGLFKRPKRFVSPDRPRGTDGGAAQGNPAQ